MLHFEKDPGYQGCADKNVQVRLKTDQGVVSLVNRPCRTVRQVSEPHKHVPVSYTLFTDKRRVVSRAAGSLDEVPKHLVNVCVT